MKRSVPAYVAPHADRELDPMLSGRKPLARFVRELPGPPHIVGDEDLDPHVVRGDIVRRVVRYGDIEWRRHCRPGEEWRIKVLELVRRVGGAGLGEDDLHRLDGTLLGYGRRDIARFIVRAHRLRRRRSRSS